MSTDTIDNLSEETLNEIKELIGDDYQEAADNMIKSDNDFIVGDYRFIHRNAIDDILTDELISDPYILGCFKADFIASVTDWPLVLIEAAQKGEQYEAIGEAIIDADKASEMAAEYAAVDTYGHHFATYDGNEHELADYYAFRVS